MKQKTSIPCQVCGGPTYSKLSNLDDCDMIRFRVCRDPDCGHKFYTIETDCDEERGKAVIDEIIRERNRQRKERKERRDDERNA